jgi:tetratricopeptide (TPR) repeat protein
MYKGFRRGAIDPRNRSDSTVMTNDASASPAPDPGDTAVGDTASSAEVQRDVRLGQQGDVAGAGETRDSIPRPSSAAHESDADYRLAAALYTSGQLSQAEQTCLDIVRQRGRQAEVLHLLGAIALDNGRLEQAISLFDEVVALRPDIATTYNNRGNALARQKRHADAVANYAAAIALRPDYAAAYNNRGSAFADQQRFQDALADHDKAIAIQPDHADAHHNRGVALAALGRHAEAVAAYERAIGLLADRAETHNNHGVALMALKRHGEALASFDRALESRPDFVDARNNRGAVLVELDRLDEAISDFDAVTARQPDHAEAHHNRGMVLYRLDRPTEAIRSHDIAIALGNAEALWSKSLCLLSIGDFEQGWELYECRFANTVRLARTELAMLPRWNGRSCVDGKTILVHAEQGLGDTLQFCRYVPMLGQTCRVILDVHRPLKRLLTTLPGVDQIVAHDDPLPAFDAWVPLLSLPLAFHTTLGTIPAEVPYLTAEPERVAIWRQGVAALPGRKLGLVWAGTPLNTNDRRRSITLQQLAPLARIPGLSLISLQYGDAAEQARTPPDGMMLHDWNDELAEFADVAALIENLDLVISVDTAAAHLAGALGKPVWLLTCFASDWRWLRGRTDSPWYPTVRLFRQTSPGDWASVVDKVVDALRELA